MALALSEILASWGRLIEHRERIRSPWLYLAATGWLFSFLIVHWLGLWVYRELDFTQVRSSFIIFSPSIVGALAAYAFTPSLRDEGVIDLGAHYLSVAPWAFVLVAVCVILAGLSDLLLVPGGEPLPLYVFLGAGTVLGGLSRVRNLRVHASVLGILWVVIVWGVLFARI